MTMATATTTRWRPTPDQLMILEELYIGGIKTPSAGQIQRITAHLSLYGKIECKNVFYWFQNHKAREKQKLRKRLLLGKQLQQQQKQPPLPLPLPLPLPPPPPHHQLHHHNIFGHQSYHHDNNVLYLQLQPAAAANYNCGFLHSQGGIVRCGSPQMIDSKWVKLYCPDHKDDALMTPAGTTTTTSPTRSIETLQLFPTTSTKLRPEHHPTAAAAPTTGRVMS